MGVVGSRRLCGRRGSVRTRWCVGGGGGGGGGGRPRLTESDSGLVAALEALVDPETRGDPESPLRWCSKSLQKIASALVDAGHQISDRSAGKLLRGLGFRLHANVKTRE